MPGFAVLWQRFACLWSWTFLNCQGTPCPLPLSCYSFPSAILVSVCFLRRQVFSMLDILPSLSSPPGQVAFFSQVSFG